MLLPRRHVLSHSNAHSDITVCIGMRTLSSSQQMGPDRRFGAGRAEIDDVGHLIEFIFGSVIDADSWVVSMFY